MRRSSIFKPNRFFFTRNDGVVQMTKLTYQIATVFAVLALVGSVQAEDKEKSCCAAKDASACCAAMGCENSETCSATLAAHGDKK